MRESPPGVFGRLVDTQAVKGGAALSSFALSDLVQDWGGFEKLVALLHETGEVTVEHNVTLRGRSGASRQIDVLVRHTQGLYEHKVIVECKYLKQPVERLHVDALATAIREVGADRGVIFSTRGFQRGAILEAQQQGIELFRVRELTDEEWGLPGRIFDAWIQVISLSIGNLRTDASHCFANAYKFGSSNVPAPTINLVFGDDSAIGTAIYAEGRAARTLEELLIDIAIESSRRAHEPVRIQFEDNGYNGEMKLLINVEYRPKKPLEVFIDGTLLIMPEMTFQVGIRIEQSRLQHDRAQNSLFVLALEDCIRNRAIAASRSKDGGVTILSPREVVGTIDHEKVYKNGSIVRVWAKGLLPFELFANLEPGKPIAQSTSKDPQGD